MKRWQYTVRNGEIAQCRRQTYKNNDAFMRAYYKFICKQGWYSPMRDGRREPIRNLSGTGFWMAGLPVFRSWRSEAYREFELTGEHGAEGGFQKKRAELLAEEEMYNRMWESRSRLNDTEMKTGVDWRWAAVELDIIPELTPETPVDLIEAKQFQMALRRTINSAKKAKRTHTK